MVRASSSSSSKSAAAAAPVVGEQPVIAASTTPKVSKKDKSAAPVADAPVADAKPVKESKPKKAAAPAAAPAPAVVAVDAAVPDNVVVDVSAAVAAVEVSSSAKIASFGAKLRDLAELFNSVKADFKALEKSVSRDLKASLKSSSKKAKKAKGDRKPSGFTKATLIGDELAQFLGKAPGTEMARTDVSREMNAYIKANKLQDEKNGRDIIPNAELAKLLNIDSTVKLSYFNLQKYMKHHFVKAATAPVV